MGIHSSIIYNSQKAEIQFKCLSVGEWINKRSEFHTLEYDSAKKKGKSEWIIKTLSYVKEVRHKKSYIVWFHLYEMSRIGKGKTD
jgi:antibiotic biosynthesis monooxygenase (ABM) superfamily enzyme